MRPTTWYLCPAERLFNILVLKVFLFKLFTGRDYSLMQPLFWIGFSVQYRAVNCSMVVCNATVQYCLYNLFKAYSAVLTEVCTLLFCGHRPCLENLLRFQLPINLDYVETNLIDFQEIKFKVWRHNEKNLHSSTSIHHWSKQWNFSVKFRVLLHWCKLKKFLRSKRSLTFIRYCFL